MCRLGCESFHVYLEKFNPSIDIVSITMGFFGSVWKWITSQIPTWEQATDWNYWVPSWEQVKDWHYWVRPLVIIGGVIMVGVGLASPPFVWVWEHGTDYLIDSWDYWWWWINKVLNGGFMK